MKFKLTVLLATFVVMMGLMLGTAQAATVVFDSIIPDRAIGITDLDIDSTPYNVIFISGQSPENVYGDLPGEFDFNTKESAKAATNAVADALNTVGGVLYVGSEGGNNNTGATFYSVGYESFIAGPADSTRQWRATGQDGTWLTNVDTTSLYGGDPRTWAIFTATDPPEPVDEVTIGGSVFFLMGSGLVLQNNGAADETVNPGTNPENPVPFTFDTTLAPGSIYEVTVKTQPSSPDQQCIVARGSGTVPIQAVTNVVVVCGSYEGPLLDEIIGAWSNGIWYWDLFAATWTQLSTDTPTGDIAAGDFNGDGIADVAAIFDDLGPVTSQRGQGIYYLDGDSKTWNRFLRSEPAPFNIAAGDINGDINGNGASEIIGTWSNGIWYRDETGFSESWVQLTTDTTTGDIAAGDFTGDGIADVAAIFQEVGPASNPLGAGIYLLDGRKCQITNQCWTKVAGSAPAPFSVAAGDMNGDGRSDIIGTWSNGIYYWDVVEMDWTQLSTDTTQNGIAAGNILLNGTDAADVVAIFQISPFSTPEGVGLFTINGDNMALTKVPGSAPAPFSVTAGDVSGN
jgi:hypothetical protein